MYRVNVEGRHFELGTSGFLYRSNKLMYDHETKSLWSTLQGIPVVGPLVGQGIELPKHHVVTTTWGQWKLRHPETSVLNLNTGFDRDYSEGAAYRDYFSNDLIKYAVPKLDDRLPNKAEVLALRSGSDELAIDMKWLKQSPVFHETLDGKPIVILTDPSGSSRVYEAKQYRFRNFDGEASVTSGEENAVRWDCREDGLYDAEGNRLKRLPSHRAFWFGWQSQFPESRLILQPRKKG